MLGFGKHKLEDFQGFRTDVEFEQTYKVQVLKEKSSQDFPDKGDHVKVHYLGTLINGQKFDASRDRKKAFEFQVGVQKVIACWDEVIMRMAVGERVKVLCPSDKAYGDKGFGDLIPPNSDLYFEIWMLGFAKQQQDL